MKIMFFRGGVGNQLFQYAYYLYLKEKTSYNIKIDSFSPGMRKRYGFQLPQIFPAVGSCKDFLPYFIARPLYLLVDGLNKIFKISFFDQNKEVKNTSFSPNKLYIKGFWPEAGYLEEIKEKVQDAFEFISIEEADSQNFQVSCQIQDSNSVAVHIRRGNYLKPRQRVYFGDLCGLDYYKKAIDFIKEKVNNPMFFIFSDDIEWVKENLNLAGGIYINWNTGKNSFRDMQLMSLCKHNIIANSTFSWWGAWLNRNEDKIVIAPEKWLNNTPQLYSMKLIPVSWTKIGDIRPFVSLIPEIPLKEKDIRCILSQKYGDFELLVDQQYESVKDQRLVFTANSLRGVHKRTVTKSMLKEFEKANYLQKMLIKSFEDDIFVIKYLQNKK